MLPVSPLLVVPSSSDLWMHNVCMQCNVAPLNVMIILGPFIQSMYNIHCTVWLHSHLVCKCSHLF